jgi:hypothetical protein
MDSFFLAVTAVGLVESVTVNVNVEAPTAEGVPEIAPEALLRLSPVGSFPEVTDQVTGGSPPLAARPTMYAVLTWAAGSEAVVMVRAAVIAIESFTLAVSAVGVLESVAVTVKLSFPAAVGVPVMAPVPPFRVRPSGRLPELTVQVSGTVPPAAASVAPE